MIEIERKFLVKDDSFKSISTKHFRITQAYLNSTPERVVRIRRKGDNCFLTIKGKSNKSGLSRFEWEKEISLIEFEQLLPLCEPGIIDKTRYLVQSNIHTFEIDVFYGDNEGLVLAEVELSAEDEQFTAPDFIDKEVTGDSRYYNSYLTKNPYNSWEN